ncbi:MAG: MYG1 family protein [Opitutales bacterium]
MSITKIITHPGGAHKDEFLACSVLLAIHPVPVVRREPEPDDLADAATCVVDVGHRHDPERNNFDHHQFPGDRTPTCSLSLVLQHLGLYEDALEFCDWLEPAEWFDCRGPVATAKWMGVERDAMSKLNSPIDVSLLRRFAMSGRLQAGDPLWEVMRMIGGDLLDYVKSLRERLDFIDAYSEVWELSVNRANFRVLYLPRTDPLPGEPSTGMGRYIENNRLRGVSALIYPDRRGPGYGLSRFNDDPRLDFTRIEDEEDVHFTHKRGFVAKVSATERSRLKTLVAAAWVG